MAGVFVKSVNAKWIQLERSVSYSYDTIAEELRSFHGMQDERLCFKFYHGCQEISPGFSCAWPEKDVFINTTISLAGGKGGFGSMLRAIGAQIEKTTNREACRDLSGRRLRDINEEKRLKDWVTKQAEREKEREERKQKKLDKLRQEYKHEFNDPDYFKARSEVGDKVHEALEQGIHAASSSTVEEPIQKKRKVSDNVPALKKTALWIGVSDDESDLTSDDDETTQPTAASDDNSLSQPSGSGESQDSSQTPLSEQLENNTAASSEEPSTDVQTECIKGSKPQEIEKTEPAETAKTEEKPMHNVEPTVFEHVVLEDFASPQELETLGLNRLKFELQSRGMKCGGTLAERASRLYSVRGLSPDKIDPSLLAKPAKKK